MLQINFDIDRFEFSLCRCVLVQLCDDVCLECTLIRRLLVLELDDNLLLVLVQNVTEQWLAVVARIVTISFLVYDRLQIVNGRRDLEYLVKIKVRYAEDLARAQREYREHCQSVDHKRRNNRQYAYERYALNHLVACEHNKDKRSY